jgi:hypothetical protein
VKDALDDLASHYRKSLWADADVQVQIWIEKDALAGVVSPVTDKYDVPLRPARGYSSKSFLHEAAMEIEANDVPTHVYHFGDFDPSGVGAADKIEETLRDLAPHSDIHFRRIAVTEQQTNRWRLPTRPTKRSDSRARNFGSTISVELDAIDPDQLRSLVEKVIRKHIADGRFEELMASQEREKRQIADFVARSNKRKGR